MGLRLSPEKTHAEALREELAGVLTVLDGW
jgi:hypothetical protein